MTIRRSSRLGLQDVADVVALAAAAGDADGVMPLSEHVMLHLRYGGDDPAVHLLARCHPASAPAAGDAAARGMLIGYGHVDTTDVVEGASAELVVHPMLRRRGIGRALVTAATAAAAEADPAARLRLWAHGDHPSASALAMTLGFEHSRVLLQMRRSLLTPVDAPVLPDGVEIRPFRPGVDDEAWLAVNARAFAALPDQGGWTLADLRVRMKEAWFDPDGFLLAWRGDQLLGFHWTKVHGGDSDDHDPIGEVYVLGIDPDANGMGLGTALTATGLRYLRERGLGQVMLYVDETNTRAVGLYQRHGFVRWTTDVCFSSTATR